MRRVAHDHGVARCGVSCAIAGTERSLPAGGALASAAETGPAARQAVESMPAWSTGKSQKEGAEFTESRLGLSLLKNVALDQKAIWTSPAHLRLDDADWILPSAGIAAASLASDTHISAGLAHSTSLASKSNTFSNSGIAAFGGISGGLYLLGKLTHDDHKREAGILSGEAAIDALGTTTALQYAFGRERPASGNSAGEFWRKGTSFPSDHATAAWAVASVMAHEYPGPLTKFFVYGLASAVSLSRVTGEKHFPTDVLVGSAIGWLVGQHVYRAHHDPELGGSSWETFSEARAEQGGRNFKNAGSPHVPLDSWIYPAIDRLIALGYIHSAFQDVRPWTRTECAALVQEAGESMAAGDPARGDGVSLYAALEKEFQNEFSVLDGEGQQQSVQLESLYADVTGISGRPLNDSYHFGQTIINNFGRPYQQGFNTYEGFSGFGTAGRYTVYIRGEFQAAPSGPAYPLEAREAVATADQTPLQPAAPVPGAKQFRLLDTYISANIGGWDFSVGKQSLWWGRGVGGALILSDNAEPMYMFRMRPMEAVELPSILHWLGPMKGDFFFAKLSGNEYPARPMIHGLKLTGEAHSLSRSEPSRHDGIRRRGPPAHARRDFPQFFQHQILRPVFPERQSRKALDRRRLLLRLPAPARLAAVLREWIAAGRQSHEPGHEHVSDLHLGEARHPLRNLSFPPAAFVKARSSIRVRLHRPAHGQKPLRAIRLLQQFLSRPRHEQKQPHRRLGGQARDGFSGVEQVLVPRQEFHPVFLPARRS